jgi:hypothetical protein
MEQMVATGRQRVPDPTRLILERLTAPTGYDSPVLVVGPTVPGINARDEISYCLVERDASTSFRDFEGAVDEKLQGIIKFPPRNEEGIAEYLLAGLIVNCCDGSFAQTRSAFRALTYAITRTAPHSIISFRLTSRNLRPLLASLLCVAVESFGTPHVYTQWENADLAIYVTFRSPDRNYTTGAFVDQFSYTFDEFFETRAGQSEREQDAMYCEVFDPATTAKSHVIHELFESIPAMVQKRLQEPCGSPLEWR